jgi:hypothetical protein
MLRGDWQSELIEELRTLLEPDDDVRALVLFGSSAAPELRDELSDVDVMLVAREGAGGRFFPDRAWFGALGNVFAWEQSARERSGAHRVYFTDGRRLDVVVVEEPVVADVEHWPQHPFRAARRTIFSRSPAADRAVATVYERVPAGPPSAEQFAARANAFWFEAPLAAHKAARGDLLIAAHLQLGLVRSCMELAMILRDRAAGTRHHRKGAPTDAAFLAQAQALLAHDMTGKAVIGAVAAVAQLFDDLAQQWDAAYERQLPILQPMLVREVTRV